MSFMVEPQPDACRARKPEPENPPPGPPNPPMLCHMPKGHEGPHSNERRPGTLSRRWEGDARPVSSASAVTLLERAAVDSGDSTERVADERLAEIADALVAIGKACLVVAPTLRKPYPDDPTQNPWDKFVHDPAKRAYNLGHDLRRELRARSLTPRIEPEVSDDGQSVGWRLTSS